MRATLNGIVLAESERTEVVEGNHYFPPESVDWERLQPGRGRSLCVWKGMARYLDADTAEGPAEGVAWVYPRPYPWIRRIRGYVAFWGPVRVES